jgi:hypothetical protein
MCDRGVEFLFVPHPATTVCSHIAQGLSRDKVLLLFPNYSVPVAVSRPDPPPRHGGRKMAQRIARAPMHQRVRACDSGQGFEKNKQLMVA